MPTAICGLLLLPAIALAADPWVPTSRQSFLAARSAAFSCLARNENKFAEQGHDVGALHDYYTSFANRAFGADGELLDLDDRNLRVAYLALKKLVVHCDRPDRIGLDFGPPGGDLDRSGVYDEHSEIVGIKSRDLAQLRAEAKAYPAILRFGFSLYQNVNSCPDFSLTSSSPSSRTYMLPTNEESAIRKAASEALDSYLAEFGVPRSQATMKGSYGTTWVRTTNDTWAVELRMPLNLSSSNSRAGSRFTHVVDRSGRYLHEDGEPVGFHPTELLILHELGHVERVSVGEDDHFSSEEERLLVELGPSLEDIVRADAVLKRARGLPPTVVLAYRFKLPSRAGDLDPGIVASHFRPLIEEHGSAERALLSPRGLGFVLDHYSNEDCR